MICNPRENPSVSCWLTHGLQKSLRTCGFGNPRPKLHRIANPAQRFSGGNVPASAYSQTVSHCYVNGPLLRPCGPPPLQDGGVFPAETCQRSVWLFVEPSPIYKGGYRPASCKEQQPPSSKCPAHARMRFTTSLPKRCLCWRRLP